MAEINELIPADQLESLTRRDRKKQETRWRMYNAAIALMARRGFDDVTIEDICDAADVSTPLFFHHFSNKGAVVRAYLECLKADIAQQLRDAGDITNGERLDIINRQVTRSAQDTASFTPQLLAEMFRGEGKLDMEHLDTGITGAVGKIIRDGQASGEFSEGWHPEVVAVGLVGAWLMMPLAAQGEDLPDEPMGELLDLIKTGLKTPR